MKLESPWAADLDPAKPLPEYPRPSLVREEWLSLNGLWDYAIRPEGQAPASFDGSIVVPFPVESRLSGVERPLRPGEVLWYRRRIRAPEAWRGRRVMLRFGAADWEARAGVNGVALGTHRGGFAPFAFDATEALGPGLEGELLVEVRDPTEAGTQCRGKQTLRPRGILYTAASGLWGSVWMEPVPEARIERLVAAVPAGASVAQGRLAIRASLSLPAGDRRPRALRATLREGERAIAEGRVEIASGAPGPALASLELRVPGAKAWSPESPFLYGLSVELEGPEPGAAADRAESYAAFRTVALGPDAAGRPRILLNGEPTFNLAVLDQGYWPEGVYTAPSDEALASDVVRAKELGFNAIRKHTKTEAERWYWHCDRLGILVWQDIPPGGRPMSLLYSVGLGFSGARLDDRRRLSRFGREDAAGRADFEREAAEIVEALEGFPSIVAWVPFNEGWGQFESARVARELAARDPTRLVDAASGWYDSGGGHFSSRHDYSASPRLPRADGSRALALSEYGGLTMRVEGHSTQDRRQFGYAGARDPEDLARRYEALAARLARQTAAEGLAAAVYTQISDVEIERNGLLTYDRRVVKADAARIRAANEALIAAGSGRKSG